MDNSRKERDLAINEFIKTNDTRAIYLKLIPKLYRELFYRIYTGNNSRADAVKAKCLECKSMSRREIKECSNSLCPLFDFKPYK